MDVLWLLIRVSYSIVKRSYIPLSNFLSDLIINGAYYFWSLVRIINNNSWIFRLLDTPTSNGKKLIATLGGSLSIIAAQTAVSRLTVTVQVQLILLHTACLFCLLTGQCVCSVIIISVRQHYKVLIIHVHVLYSFLKAVGFIKCVF